MELKISVHISYSVAIRYC